jgi:hypothetical protein
MTSVIKIGENILLFFFPVLVLNLYKYDIHLNILKPQEKATKEVESDQGYKWG